MDEELDQYRPDWDLYLIEPEGEAGAPTIVALDLGLGPFAPVQELPVSCRVRTSLQRPTEDGLPDDAEFDKLEEIEQELIEHLSSKAGAVLAGRVTRGGVREWYLFAPDGIDAQQALAAGGFAHEGYSFDVQTAQDPEWSAYFDILYPDKFSYQRIVNRRLLASMRDQGDVPESARPIDHWMYFPTSEGRESVWGILEERGFQLVEEEYRDESDYPFGLHVSAAGTMDDDAIDNLVLDLMALVEENGGVYDGWECEVVNA